ncbi:putative pumilio-repeat, RNA-binding protein [Trypanosoma cruzi]|uniref:Pumilio-repeat, RNA-binding protein, putative n=2 Tax=Trypanosoma cruzi TaxID=5693 RepID=Q4DZK8_TRYCC|nr:pumilio-repeat, RNA-binding protein, putative [Trypanosoma cruzi]EAN97946.1 pumilio-repeat, RNA-binding protein, putative [Trypanosoma cruzi]PWV13456.1 putative pumilio-repeat, RNA-binding protein [Trypanosoma cruzi]RNC41089.1 putative pumilio-repeat, RNA-binding protein [Trypanosoma cruzi]|eukprot:XP_819797.1 pumilio-repeat, RNA-binding protein [Trypanosoma cruzi strain CL Brener]
MGKKANFERAHQRQVQHTREQRKRKVAAARALRIGEDTNGRRIQRYSLPKVRLSDEKKKMLVEQFTQACRLPATSEDLCMLLRSACGEKTQDDASRKRRREETTMDESNLGTIVDAFLQWGHQAAITTDESDEDEPMTLLEDVLQDECGGRVVCALIAALDTSKNDKKPMVLDAVTKLFEENETLHEHYVACKVMSSLVQYGDRETQERVLDVLQQHAKTVDQLQAQLRNRHSAVTIQHLIEHFPTETLAWLGETLGVTELLVGKKMAKKKRMKKTNHDECDRRDTLLLLILDPVASPIIRALISRSVNTSAFLENMDLVMLLETKRGCRFLQDILSPALPKWNSEGEATVTLDVVMKSCETKLLEMCTSIDANFVVQAIIGLIPRTEKASTDRYFKQLLKVLGPHLSSLATHYIGVHVVVALVVSSHLTPMEDMAEEIAGTIITGNNVADMLCDSNGSLVVRKLLPLCKRKGSKVGQMLLKAINQDMSSLMYDAIGNLTLQEYIKVCGGEEIARKLCKSDELLSMCQHTYASHVVGSLFENVGATTHTNLCHALRPHVLTLSRHLNGRFIVEKAIYANRDICDLLLRHFMELACEKGTQHVLCTLMLNSDQRGREWVVNTVISGLVDLATQQCGSIVLQKLMLADALLLAAVKKELAQKPRLRNNLAQNFFGKFVVQITDAAGEQGSPSSPKA